MFSLSAVLQLLHCLFALVCVFRVLIAFVELCWKNATVINNGAYISMLSRRSGATLLLVKTTKQAPMVLYRPIFALHTIAYHTLLPQIPPSERSYLLRGRRFASLADSIVNGIPSAIIGNMRIKLPSAKVMARMRYLETLPELIVTPPDDGNRSPKQGEKGGPKVRVMKGLLAPPKKRSRAGKEIRNKERGLEKTKAPGRG